MNYSIVYNNIIDNSIKSKRTKNSGVYYEKHHIKPKCIGGLDSADNLVLLTAKEHYICHHLLTKIYPESNELKVAFSGMCYRYSKEDKRTYAISSVVYEKAKQQHSDIMRNRVVSQETRDKMSASGKVKHFTDEHKKNMSIARRNAKKQPAQGLVHTEKSLKLMSEKQSGENNGFYGKTHTEDTIKKLREINLGKILPTEQKDKISQSMSKLKWYNDGTKNARLEFHPGDGWVLGRLKFKRNKLKKENK